MSTTTTITENSIQAGLFELAVMLTPEVQLVVGDSIEIHLTPGEGVVLDIDYIPSMDKIRKLRRVLGGGAWNKEYTDWNYVETREVSPNLTITLSSPRYNVCKRVQVGTKTVEKPDYEAIRVAQESAPKITVEEPIYEWECNDQ